MIEAPNPILFTRHKHLLGLLDAMGGGVENLDFQRLLFLYCQETGPVAGYEFVPHRLGVLSFTSDADRRKLSGRGLMDPDEGTWRLTDAGRRSAQVARDVRRRCVVFSRKYADLRGDALAAETYRRYPYFGTRSEIAERVLEGDSVALARIVAARPRAGTGCLATIGYEGRSLESYLNALLLSGITLLCDVRRNPISRKYGFSKTALAQGCEGVGIRYVHLPELGIASAQRRNLETQGDYDNLFLEYQRNCLPAQVPALQRIDQWVRRGERVALTCYEREPTQCHRGCVAAALEQRFGQGFTATHL